MAEEIERLLVRIEANAEHFEKSLRKMNGELRKSQKGTNDALRRIQTDVQRQSARMFSPMGDALRREIAGFAGIMAAAFSVRQIIDYADGYTNLQNRLKAAGLEGQRLKDVENDLYEAANRNGVAIDAVAQMYQRVSQSRNQLGASDEQLIAMTNGVTAALRVQGVSAQEAAGPLLQLGQALGAGTVRAEELNSLLEGTPIILQAAANGSARFGGDMQKLAAAIRKGEVSSKEFFAALLTGLPELEARAANLPMTVGQALQALNNELGKYVGRADTGLSATARMAQAIEALSENLDTIIPIVVTLTGVIGAGLVASLTAAASAKLAAAVAAARLTSFQIAMTASMTGATRAQVALNMAMAANPIGLVVTAVAALAGGLYLLIDRYNSTAVAQRQLSALQSSAEGALADYRQAVLNAASASDEERKGLIDKANALRQVTQERINDMRVMAAQQRLEADDARARAAEERRRADAYRASSSGAGWSNARAAQVGGNDAAARGAESYAARAEAEAQKAEADVKRLSDALREAQNTRPPSVDPLVEKDKGKTSKASGPTPEELAERRQILSLQMQIEAAQARGDKEAERSARARLDTLQLTKQLTDAQMENAAQVARDHIQMLTEAELAEERLGVLVREKAKREDQAKKRREQERDVLMDTFEIEAELARLRGDPAAIEAAERRLFVEQRINELMAQREGMSRKEASNIANKEYADFSDADREGAMRDEFRRSFRDGIKAAMDGDVGGFFENMADRFTDRMLDNLADNLFNILSNAMKGMNAGGGGGFWSSIIGAFGGGFGGGRAAGGPVTAGRLYRINENTPNSEFFMPGTNGTVLNSGQVRGLHLGGGGGTVVQTLQFDMRGAVMTEDLLRQMDAKANAARLGAVAQVASVSAQQQRKGQFRTRGR
ncbi:tape measure protein [Brevundimonas sp.]|uniref:tape measure protein n=1 Tax=Brevundimonas sp. TaxID=1871086 RepID=UPI00289D86A7|nr:tape measure protein [Brevundimonas sp.]